MTDHSRLALVGAFGATYISLAIADIDELTVSNFALLNSADFEMPMDAVTRYLKSVPAWPNKASFAFTGDLADETAHVEARGWTISKNDLRVATHASNVLMSRDIEALARMLPHLAPHDLIAVDKGTPSKHGTRLVVNSGAALGVAALVHGSGEWVPVAGYAGETSLRDNVLGSMQGELLSGRGLIALYQHIAAEKKVGAKLHGARAIAAGGLAGEDEAAAEAVRVMAVHLAQFTADMALTFGARGGIFLAGGLAANILPPAAKTVFGAELTARIAPRLGDVPVHIIKTGADAVIRGCALAMGQAAEVTTRQRRTLAS